MTEREERIRTIIRHEYRAFCKGDTVKLREGVLYWTTSDWPVGIRLDSCWPETVEWYSKYVVDRS